jgi:hypothetical protein
MRLFVTRWNLEGASPEITAEDQPVNLSRKSSTRYLIASFNEYPTLQQDPAGCLPGDVLARLQAERQRVRFNS